MSLSKILLALAVVALLASNGYQVYQNNRIKLRVDKLQSSLQKTQQTLKDTESSVNIVCGSISDCTL